MTVTINFIDGTTKIIDNVKTAKANGSIYEVNMWRNESFEYPVSRILQVHKEE